MLSLDRQLAQHVHDRLEASERMALELLSQHHAALLALATRLAEAKTLDGWLRHDVVPRVQVILFFALLQVFDNHDGLVPLGDRISFFTSLFGAGL